jgi:hypothetical protein
MAPSSILPPASAREGRALRTRIGEIELARDPALEQVEVGLENDAGLHDVQIMDPLPVDARQNFREKIGLLLVVALEADPIARADDSLEKRLCTLRRRQLAFGVAGTCIQAGFPLAPLLLPVFGVAGVSPADALCPIWKIGASSILRPGDFAHRSLPDAAPGGRVGPPELNQFFASRAGVTVALGIEYEVGPGECAVGPVGFVEDWMCGVIFFCLTSQARLSADP